MSKSSEPALGYDDLDPMARAYVEAVVFFFGCSGFISEWEDITVHDFAPGMLAMVTRDCTNFLAAASKLHPAGTDGLLREIDDEQLGHTFFLSRQGSGSTFVGEGIDYELADGLDAIASKHFGYVEVEIGDDKQIHF